MLLSQMTGGGEGINGRCVVCSFLERITEDRKPRKAVSGGMIG